MKVSDQVSNESSVNVLRDLILNADDLRTEVLTVPEWGTDILIQAMSAEDRARFALSGTDDEGNRDETAYVQSSARVAVLVCHHPITREPIFTEADVAPLSKKSARALDEITKVAFRLSGLGDDEKKVVEDQFRQ